ncbi:hypothetical protein P7C71_g3184, partial [Lecanoromycetidae sp. Uapishka_2]
MQSITSIVTVAVMAVGMLSTVKGYACGPPGNQCFPVEYPGCYTPYSTYEGLPIIGYDGYTEAATNVGAGCYTTTVAGVFWTGKDTDASIGQFLNGPCGHLVLNGTSNN